MAEGYDIDPTIPPSGPGCVECLAAGGWWFHLRRCAHCGHVGCCDSSPSQHASRHAASEGHAVVQSFEPGEDWFWDYSREEDFDGPRPGAAAPSSPGPAACRARPVACPTTGQQRLN